MTVVQIAIQDRRYARALHDLLVADGTHSVYVVDYPSSAIEGVVVADENILERITRSEAIDFSRYVVFMRQLDFDANRLFAAGVRHVIHAESPPDVGHLIVIAAERRLGEELAVRRQRPALGEDVASVDREQDRDVASLFNAADKSFLRALRISDH